MYSSEFIDENNIKYIFYIYSDGDIMINVFNENNQHIITTLKKVNEGRWRMWVTNILNSDVNKRSPISNSAMSYLEKICKNLIFV